MLVMNTKYSHFSALAQFVFYFIALFLLFINMERPIILNNHHRLKIGVCDYKIAMTSSKKIKLTLSKNSRIFLNDVR